MFLLHVFDIHYAVSKAWQTGANSTWVTGRIQAFWSLTWRASDMMLKCDVQIIGLLVFFKMFLCSFLLIREAVSAESGICQEIMFTVADIGYF